MSAKNFLTQEFQHFMVVAWCAVCRDHWKGSYSTHAVFGDIVVQYAEMQIIVEDVL
jgi:hypothetical protein